MPVRFLRQSLQDHSLQHLIRTTTADHLPKIPSRRILQTGLQKALRSQPDPVTLPTELMAHRADKPDLSGKTIHIIIMTRSIPKGLPNIRRKPRKLFPKDPKQFLL